MRVFKKNDDEFECRWCGKMIPKLKYSSRDHCTRCLTSIHIDINPGDRACNCLGTLFPIDVTINNKKGYIITYKCDKCGIIHNNKSAEDDHFSTLLKVMNKTYDKNYYKK